MTPRNRIAFEVFAPAAIGAGIFLLWDYSEIQATLGFNPRSVLGFVAVAYILGILPSCVYAVLMEQWLRRSTLSRFGRIGVILFSSLLGTLAGSVIWLGATCPVYWIGGVSGAVVGLVLVSGISIPTVGVYQRHSIATGNLPVRSVRLG